MTGFINIIVSTVKEKVKRMSKPISPNTPNWGNIAKMPCAHAQNTKFITLQEGENPVRLYGYPICFRVIWTQGKRFVIPQQHESEIEKQGHSIKNRYAINCFDRHSTSKGKEPKILEGGKPLFSSFASFNKKTMDIGGDNGPDWIITKDSSQKTKPYTVYFAVPANNGNPVPFTDEEKEIIKQIGHSNLTEMYDNVKAENKLINFGLLPGSLLTKMKREIIENKEDQIMEEPNLHLEDDLAYKIICPICNKSIELSKENSKSYPIVLCHKCSSKFKD